MASNCSARLRELAKHIGGPEDLRAQVIFDQEYAADQHEELHYRHPRGGRAKYLETALFGEARNLFSHLAGDLLDEGEPMTGSMLEVGKALLEATEPLVPDEFGDLRHSGQIRVYEGSSQKAYVPPRIPRISEARQQFKDEVRDYR